MGPAVLSPHPNPDQEDLEGFTKPIFWGVLGNLDVDRFYFALYD
jgi:hypothetical protein